MSIEDRARLLNVKAKKENKKQIERMRITALPIRLPPKASSLLNLNPSQVYPHPSFLANPYIKSMLSFLCDWQHNETYTLKRNIVENLKNSLAEYNQEAAKKPVLSFKPSFAIKEKLDYPSLLQTIFHFYNDQRETKKELAKAKASGQEFVSRNGIIVDTELNLLKKIIFILEHNDQQLNPDYQSPFRPKSEMYTQYLKILHTKSQKPKPALNTSQKNLNFTKKPSLAHTQLVNMMTPRNINGLKMESLKIKIIQEFLAQIKDKKQQLLCILYWESTKKQNSLTNNLNYQKFENFLKNGLETNQLANFLATTEITQLQQIL